MYVVENANAGTISVRKHQQNPAVLPRQTFCMEDDPAAVRPNPRPRRRPFGAQATAVGLSTLPPPKEDSALVGIRTGPLHVLMVSRRSHPTGNLFDVATPDDRSATRQSFAAKKCCCHVRC
ncbi:hypothetical protein GQ607_016526 [Colletotrichum asianum]|uniref:Uncharacterized protein n=1 Tax=Colletotrichum asianum TaxID=702518 RepID=A0A8H3VZ86_9PEZI|nr:hypothetical protein GQ607_016526 [Colletotrichum asianum]